MRQSLIRRWRQWWLWPFALLGMLVLVISLSPLVSWWAGRLAGDWTDPEGEGLIVLAGALHSRETGPGEPAILGQNSYLRAVYALRAWRTGAFRQILVSGDEITAPAMAAFLQASGVPNAALLVDPQSRSTHDHPANCRRFLGEQGRWVLLTSDYHMYRAQAVFVRAGLNVRPRPIPDVRKYASASMIWRWQGFLMLAEESVKIAYYSYQGWM